MRCCRCGDPDGAFRVLSIGTRGRGLLPGMVGLLWFAPEVEVWRGGFVWDVDWIYGFRAADCVDLGQRTSDSGG